MQQNTQSWEAWRSEGIGASDAPIIMGKSKYLKPIELFHIKLGLKKYQPNSFITSLGHEFEPKARAMFNLLHDSEYQPKLVEMKQYSWLRASLDGWDNKTPMEIKYIGAKKMTALKAGQVDLSHWIQVQHQMMVTGSTKAIYVGYTLNKERSRIEDLYAKEVDYSPFYVQDTLWPELYCFWQRVKAKDWGSGEGEHT